MHRIFIFIFLKQPHTSIDAHTYIGSRVTTQIVLAMAGKLFTTITLFQRLPQTSIKLSKMVL